MTESSPSQLLWTWLSTEAEQVARLHRANSLGEPLHYSGLADLVVREGEHFDALPLPDHMTAEMGIPKMCYGNALDLAVRYGYDYVEGYAWVGILPVHHAWAADSERMYEVTWPDVDPEVHAYRGLRIPWSTAGEIVELMDYYGLLDDWMNGWPALRQPWNLDRLLPTYRDLKGE